MSDVLSLQVMETSNEEGPDLEGGSWAFCSDRSYFLCA
jgi:hypothetical protein